MSAYDADDEEPIVLTKRARKQLLALGVFLAAIGMLVGVAL